MSSFIFSDDIDSTTMLKSFKGVVGLGVSSVDQLMDAVAKAMTFPKYFGENWNALSDCMRDLNWIKEKRVLLVHKEIPNIKFDELAVYINILDDAVQDWREVGEHELFVVFPTSSEMYVLSLVE